MKGLLVSLLISVPLFSHGQTPNSNDSILSLVEQTPSIEKKIEILNDASAALKDSDVKSSFSYASQAYQLAIAANDSLGMTNSLLNLGRYYTRLGRHELAMENYFKALGYAEQLKDDTMIARIYNIIGNGYYFKKEIPMALRYYKKSLMTKSINEETAADLQNNIALVYIEQEKLDSANLFLSNAAKHYKKLKLPKKLASTLMNLGEVKERMQQYDPALLYYQEALEINRSLGIRLQEGVVLAQLCSILIQFKNFKDAEVNGKSALEIGLEENFQPLIIKAYEILYKLAKEKKDVSMALDYHEKLLTEKEALFNTEQSLQMEELRTKYETEQKEKENEELINESVHAERQLFFFRLLLGLSILFTAIVSILAFIYYRALLENRKSRAYLIALNRQIREQKEELTVQSEELALANNEIAIINNNLEKLVEEKTSRIVQQNERLIKYAFQNAHDVRGPLARIMGLVGLIKSNTAKKDEIPFLLNEIEKASGELDAVIREINTTLDDSQPE